MVKQPTEKLELPPHYVRPLRYFDKRCRWVAREYNTRLEYLMDNGYLDYMHWSEAVKYAPMSYLRKLCAAYGLRAGATRDKVTKAVSQNVDTAILEELFSNCVYEITDKGNAALAELEVLNYGAKGKKST